MESVCTTSTTILQTENIGFDHDDETTAIITEFANANGLDFGEAINEMINIGLRNRDR